MSLRSTSRPAATVALAALLTLVVAACGGGMASPPASPAPSAPSASAPAPSADPGAAIDTNALMAAAADKDGQAVRVTGFFLASGDTAQLCSVVLESYPPQCGGSAIRLTGAVPADVLAGLDKTSEPGLAQATWGWVIVTGTFRASGSDGRPVIEIAQIELDDSGV
jgi:hypothetical protein